MSGMDNYFDILVPETKRGLNALISEFGDTLPVDFINRMHRLATPYISYTAIGGGSYMDKSSVYDFMRLTLISHAMEGRSITDTKQEVIWLLDRLELLLEHDRRIKDEKLPPLMARVRIVEMHDPRHGGEPTVLATFPLNEGNGITIEGDCAVEVEINGQWKKIWELRISSRYEITRKGF